MKHTSLLIFILSLLPSLLWAGVERELGQPHAVNAPTAAPSMFVPSDAEMTTTVPRDMGDSGISKQLGSAAGNDTSAMRQEQNLVAEPKVISKPSRRHHVTWARSGTIILLISGAVFFLGLLFLLIGIASFYGLGLILIGELLMLLSVFGLSAGLIVGAVG